MKQKMWKVNTENGPFHFFADNKVLAHSHATTLRDDPQFAEVYVSDNPNDRVTNVSVSFTGWTKE